MKNLSTETIEGATLALEGVDNIKGGNSLALGVLSVSDGITDDTLEEGLKDTTGIFVDHSGNTLNTTSGQDDG